MYTQCNHTIWSCSPLHPISFLSPASALILEIHELFPTSLGLEWSYSSSLFSWLHLILQPLASLSTPSPSFMCSRHTVSFPTLITIRTVTQCMTVV